VFRDKFARSWPTHANAEYKELASYTPLVDALTRTHTTDAHFCAYSVPDVPRRLGSEDVFAELANGAPMVLFVVDVEPKGHAEVTREWWDGELAKFDRLFENHPGGYVYRTRGGYRIVYRLVVPFVISCAADKSAWSATYQAWLDVLEKRFGIVGDRSCHDWTRFYRLPRVVRDGKRQELETIGDPHAIGEWAETVAPTPAPPRPRASYTPRSGDFDIDAFLAAVAPGAKEYAQRGRRCWDVVCPNEANHSSKARRDSVVTFGSDGPTFHCLHDHCVHLHWADFRKHHHPEWVPFDERPTSQRPRPDCDDVDPGGDVPTPVASPWELALARAHEDIRKALGTATAAERPPIFSGGDAVDLLAQDFPVPPWLVTGLVTRGGVTTIGGEPKSTKTWAALELAVAVATGTAAFGEFFAEHGIAGYFFAEDLHRQARNRLRALLAGRGDRSRIERGRLHLRPRGLFLDLTKDDDLAWLIASCRELGKLDLVVLDPLRDLSSAAEDKSDEMGPLMRRLRLVAELVGCTVAIVHHAGKSSMDTSKRRPGQRLRGSGAIHGSTDSGFYLSDTTGDGVSAFGNTIDSEIKGARSAGRFKLELAVEDDAQGEAVKTTWTLNRETGEAKPSAKAAEAQRKAARDAEDDDKVFAFVRVLAMRGEHLSRRALREHDEAPIAVNRVTAALDRMIDGRLRLIGKDVHLPKVQQGDRS
jgi:hypothetical protein